MRCEEENNFKRMLKRGKIGKKKEKGELVYRKGVLEFIKRKRKRRKKRRSTCDVKKNEL